MYRVMKAFVEAGYGNTMTLDHTPRFAEGYEAAGSAYAIGYMRALLQRALVERAEAKLSAGWALGDDSTATEAFRGSVRVLGKMLRGENGEDGRAALSPLLEGASPSPMESLSADPVAVTA